MYYTVAAAAAAGLTLIRRTRRGMHCVRYYELYFERPHKSACKPEGYANRLEKETEIRLEIITVKAAGRPPSPSKLTRH